ncbi:sigma 54-interacting transcriptional regulator [Oryzomonas rubra]|uniref:Sigma-54-dependent Fis family transcriptional regulator n=1 Tax=Oryzomonas rubra TaxID=2509454 RepID=A0A5A9XRI5_9BACT|nr:sigma 54-interacting transcriptional regulator [Oryzomonas rubra]KAA0894231.1 sigma-54-dependent Fis family transcriptional regulator [Oryzomonas rubra]
MATLHIYCGLWEQSLSRALHEARKQKQCALQIQHIYPGDIIEKLKGLVSEMGPADRGLVVFINADHKMLAQAGRIFSAIPPEQGSRITVSYSQHSPEVGAWAKRLGLPHEVNGYEVPRQESGTVEIPEYGVTLQERRWIQYRLMRTLIAGEWPAIGYEEIIRKLRHGRLSEAEIARSQMFYERGEPDMAGGNFADVRKTDPNAIDLLRERAVQIGRSGLNTLIVGETGTGKESLAWYLHDFSMRHDQPFLALNCAFFEGERLESELFGHEQGAYTDAKRSKKGLVEEADGGTLFLDELPEMAPRVQAKLLRFLQDGTYTRLGGNKTLRASVRVVSAAQPKRMESLRQDLYYRVADVELHTVPLRELKGRDIMNIACNLAYRLMWRPVITEKGQSILTPDIVRGVWRQLSEQQHAACISEYGWPGNMRELSTLIKRFVILGDDIFEELAAKVRQVGMPIGTGESGGTDEWQRFLPPFSSMEELKERQINLKKLQPAFVRHVVASLGGRAHIQPTKLAEALGCTYNTLMSCLGDH